MTGDVIEDAVAACPPVGLGEVPLEGDRPHRRAGRERVRPSHRVGRVVIWPVIGKADDVEALRLARRPCRGCCSPPAR